MTGMSALDDLMLSVTEKQWTALTNDTKIIASRKLKKLAFELKKQKLKKTSTLFSEHNLRSSLTSNSYWTIFQYDEWPW